MDTLDDIRRATSQRVGAKSTLETVDSLRRVAESPDYLTQFSGENREVYSLARMVASEDYSANAETMLALAEAARNKASARGVSLYTLLTRSTRYTSHDGYYGEQAAGKWASTRVDPNGKHVAAARLAVEANTSFSRGAVDFFAPALQDSGVQGTTVLRKTSEEYIRERYEEGLAWIGPISGIDPRKQMFFARNGVDIDSAFLAAKSGGGKKRGGGGGALIAFVILAAAIGGAA